MKELKGKCKTCFGCNRLDDDNFKGVRKCKNYIRANKEEHITIIIVLIVEALMFILLGWYAYYRISILCGG